ncbi:MAG: endonuclease III [Coriobacteriales bacterium]|jgi:endonuclease-3
MPREAKAKKRERAIEVCRRMDELYPQAQPALHFNSPFECVIAVALSAQTTDAAVNKVLPEVFGKWPTPEAMAQADPDELEAAIHSIGFHHNKARNCVACARMIMSDFGGEVPQTMEELTRLPGVGRKTANIVLNECFGIVEGIAVDTHVFRIAHKLKLSNKKTPAETESDLLDLLPKELWRTVNSQWILFGREWCIARRPRCGECPLTDICPSAGK